MKEDDGGDAVSSLHAEEHAAPATNRISVYNHVCIPSKRGLRGRWCATSVRVGGGGRPHDLTGSPLGRAYETFQMHGGHDDHAPSEATRNTTRRRRPQYGVS